MNGGIGLGSMSTTQAIAAEAECREFIAELPLVFDLESPDLSKDTDQPHYVFQRCQLHIVIYMTLVQICKPYLTRSSIDQVSSQGNHFRSVGVDAGLNLLRLGREFWAHEFFLNAKFNIVVFCVFDTAIVLCSAIIHDSNKTLPQRQEVMDSINETIETLHKLSLTTRIGASSYNFLRRLTQATPELSKHASIRKRRKTKSEPASAHISPETSVSQGSAPTAPSPETPAEAWQPVVEPIPQQTAANGMFDFDGFFQHDSMGDPSQLAAGCWEELWDWGTLNLSNI
jgi:hypothetical protein